jgi:hypothetical protein
MPVRLRSFDQHGEFAAFEPASGQLSLLPAGEAAVKGQGIYKVSESGVICLYRSGDDLMLAVDARQFSLDNNVTAQVELINGHHELKLMADGNQLARVRYQRPPLDPNQEPFSDLEDFDIGMFVQKLTRDPARRARIFRR